MVTDEQLKANSIYQYGYVEKYHIVDPGNQDPVEFGRLYDELGGNLFGRLTEEGT